jgi:hypothetical protein
VARFGVIDRCHKPQRRNLRRTDTPKQCGKHRLVGGALSKRPRAEKRKACPSFSSGLFQKDRRAPSRCSNSDGERPDEAFERALMPDYEAPSNYKDKDKIAAYVESKQQEFLTAALEVPYTATFDQVFMVDTKYGKVIQWDHSAEPGKPSVSQRVRTYFVNIHGVGWSAKDYKVHNPPFRVIGFNPRRFLKMLALECSMPAIGEPLPPKMWYSNAEHRDIGEAILPKDFRDTLSLEKVLLMRRPVSYAARERWDKVLEGWKGPHVHPEKDAWLTVELASQLGFMSE